MLMCRQRSGYPDFEAPSLGFLQPSPSPLPRYIGIIGLAGNRVLIYGLQQVAGKILCGKELVFFSPDPGELLLAWGQYWQK
jgi:hypothetical protein